LVTMPNLTQGVRNHKHKILKGHLPSVDVGDKSVMYIRVIFHYNSCCTIVPLCYGNITFDVTLICYIQNSQRDRHNFYHTGFVVKQFRTYAICNIAFFFIFYPSFALLILLCCYKCHPRTSLSLAL
jgi:hypothetical protein